MPDFKESAGIPMNAFTQTHRASLLNQVVPFWTERVVDPLHGGYRTCFDSNGTLYNSNKHGWFLGRTMYTFSVLCQEFGTRPEWLSIAKAGYDFMEASSVGDGRFALLLSPENAVLNGAESIFTDHFVVKGLINYLYTLGNQASPQELEQARALLDKLLEHLTKPDVLLAECPDTRFQKHAVNFMTLAVLIESTKLFGSAYHDKLLECVNRSLYQFASDALHAPLEYITPSGNPLPVGPGRLIDAGHTMESLWFAMEAAPILGHPEWNARAAQVLNWVIDSCWDEECGGFFQHVDYEHKKPEDAYLTTDYDGTPVAWDDKIWWVQAEGLIALCMSAVNNQNEAHWNLFVKLYQYVCQYFVSPENGEWYSFLHRNASILSDLPGSMHKGPYHVPRCLMMLVKVLDEALKA